MHAMIPILDNPPAAKLYTFSSHLPSKIQGDMLTILQSKTLLSTQYLKENTSFQYYYSHVSLFCSLLLMQISFLKLLRLFRTVKCFLSPPGRILNSKFMLIYDCTEVPVTLRSVQNTLSN